MKRNVLAILLILCMVIGLVGCGTKRADTSSTADTTQETAIYKAGTYAGVASGKNGNLKVEVTFTDTAIESIVILEHSETEGVSDETLIKIPETIVKNQSLAVDSVSGASMTSNAIIAAVEDAVKQAGGDVEALKVAITSTEPVKTEEESYDVVVIGAGASGTSAALAAVENGASVLLLEKTASPMGASTLAGGMFAADSAQQIAQDKVVDKKWLYDQYMDISGGYINSLLVRKIIDEAGKTVDWLQENGCEMKLVDAGTGGSFEHIGMPSTLHGYQEGGTVAITKLVESFINKGGKAYFSTPASKLLYDADGKITGVSATKEDGTILNISAKAVVIATGGYGGNAEMLEQYIGANFTMGEIAHNKGDGILMAWDAGADESGIGVTQYFWQTFSSEEIGKMAEIVGDAWWSVTDFSKFPNLRVNLEGKRFSDETKATLYAVHGAEIHMQPGETEYVIIDSNMLNRIKRGGTVAIEDQFGKWKDNPQFYMEFNEPNDTSYFNMLENTPTDYTEIFDPLVGTGVVFKGDTLEALAASLGVNVNNFNASVAQYNEAVQKGTDSLFFSDTKRLLSVSEGPFYAVKFKARNLGTLGGVRINENIQAVDALGNPIQGLYVAGADAGGMYGKSYVDFEGGTLGFAFTSGRLAGLNASNALK